MAGMRYDEIREALKQHFSQLLSEHKKQVAAAGPIDERTLGAIRAGRDFAQQASERNGPIVLEEIEADYLKRFIDQYSLPLAAPSPAFDLFKGEFKKAYRSFCDALLQHQASLNDFDLEGQGEARPQFSRPSGNSLEDVSDRFMAESRLGERWTAKTEGERAQHIKLLFEILGAKTDIQAIRAPEARRTKEILQRYPRNRNKDARTRGLTLAQILDLDDVQTIHIQSINKYLQTYSAFFLWAKNNRYVDENPFQGLSIRRGARQSKGGRIAFSPEQLQIMLGELRQNTRGLIRKDYHKWGPLIAIYSGARLNEIAQIHLSDIRQEKDIWCLDLNDEGEDKELKTEASRRLVPIHPELKALGFLEHVQQLRDQGRKKLFESLTYCPKNGWGRNLGRWFNETFLVKLDLKSEEYVFHCLRHTVVTRLMQAGVEEPMVKAIVGHAQTGVTQQNYFKQGYTLQQLSDALGKLALTNA
jgi:integrase